MCKKESTTWRAFKLYHSFNPKYFPLMFLQIFFENAAPYFTLWMSSEIVTALYQGRRGRELYLLIGMTLVGNLLIRILGAALKREAETQHTLLKNNEAAAFNAKTLSLDYDQLENPEVRRHRRRIIENSYIDNYGVGFLERPFLAFLFGGIINIGFSLVLFAEMISFLAAAGFQWTGLLLLAALVVIRVINLAAQSRQSKISAMASEKISDIMLKENRLTRGQRANNMDNRIYKQQEILKGIYESMARMHLKATREGSGLALKAYTPVLLTEKLSELCSYLLVIFYCVLGAFPVGSVIKYVGYLNRMCDSIRKLLLCGPYCKSNEPFLQVYLDYFDIKNDMYQGSLSVEKRSDKKFDIEFKNVSFRYPGTEQDALQNINLTLKVGERLAVVGENGSGKTTFIKLLCRLYDPTAGEIFMNDFNLRKYDYRQYLDLFSVVFQDYKLLALPLGNNVASAEAWDGEKAERLLNEVGFGERYAGMPRGLDTPLYKDFDEEGVNVSGGEAQKIALARALYKDAPFIILDEPTAALDPVAEAEIYGKFDEIVGDKTAIYISHRLSSCRFCDKIAVFEQGKIVQVGTHEELLAQEGGKYAELWHAQAQYYTEKTA